MGELELKLAAMSSHEEELKKARGHSLTHSLQHSLTLPFACCLLPAACCLLTAACGVRACVRVLRAEEAAQLKAQAQQEQELKTKVPHLLRLTEDDMR